MTRSVELVVKGAEKRDAGRGIARLSGPTCRELGILSGETVLLDGPRGTVAKVWPGGDEGVVRIDADTRRNADLTVGDTVTVRPIEVADASRVTIRLAEIPVDEDLSDSVAEAVKRGLLDRPVRVDERIHLDRAGRLTIAETTPDGTVRITEDTRVHVHGGAVREHGEGTGTGTGTRSGTGAGTGSADSGEATAGGDGARGGTASGGAAGQSSGRSSASSTGSPPPSGATAGAVSDVTYEDIGGLDDELEQVREMIELPLSEPELFRRLGVDPPKGVLLHGPPGTGKTLIAKAVANEVTAHFVTINGPEIVSKYKGDSEERLRERFAAAKENAPAIVFIDEVDAIAGARDDDADMENRVVAQLLTLMDGIGSGDEVIVIGATNRVDTIDPALRRGGRFDREIEIGVPGVAGRREILDVHTRGMPLTDDVDLDAIAERLHGFVGADIKALATEAAMNALRRYRTERDAVGEVEETDEEETSEDAGGAAGDQAGDAADADVGGGAESEDEAEGEDEAGGEGEDQAEGEAPVADRGPELVVTREDFGVAMKAVDPSAMREYVVETPTTTYADVGGLQEAKDTLREAVMWPLQYDNLFDVTRTTPPSGVLLYGPPGTGKTLLARALAGESEVNFVQVAGPELIDKYVGESEKAIRKVFERARQTAPTIVFFDEIDAIASRRGADSHEVTERVVSQLLTEIDGLRDNPNLIVLAATNRYEALDPALLRPGRLEEHVEVPLPEHEARRAILEVHSDGKPYGDDVDLDDLAAETEGYSGAELEALVRRASMLAIREFAAEHGPEEADQRADEIRITDAHFDRAKQRKEA